MSLFWNFFKAWARVQWAKVRGYEVLASPFVAQVRFDGGCRDCPLFDGAQCTICHCLAQAKVMIASERCPIGTWGPVWIKRKRRPRRVK